MRSAADWPEDWAGLIVSRNRCPVAIALPSVPTSLSRHVGPLKRLGAGATLGTEVSCESRKASNVFLKSVQLQRLSNKRRRVCAANLHTASAMAAAIASAYFDQCSQARERHRPQERKRGEVHSDEDFRSQSYTDTQRRRCASPDQHPLTLVPL